MKKLLMAAAALAAFASPGIANAADLAVPPAPPLIVPAPVLSWTGPYVGLNGGGGWGTTDHTFTGVAAAVEAHIGTSPRQHRCRHDERRRGRQREVRGICNPR